jgi:hypothetical protein
MRRVSGQTNNLFGLQLKRTLKLRFAGLFLSLMIGNVVFAAASSWCPDYLGRAIDLDSAIENETALILREGLRNLKRAIPKAASPLVFPDRLRYDFQAAGNAGYGVDGVSVYDWQLALNATTEAFHWGHFSGPSFQAQLDQQVVENLLISTHTIDASPINLLSLDWSWHRKRRGMTRKLVDNLLTKSQFQQTPRVMLINREFGPSQLLLAHTTRVQWSIAGEIPIDLPHAKNYHLVGEQFNTCQPACMQYTLKSVGRQIVSLGAPEETTIWLHASHILYSNQSTSEYSILESASLFNLAEGLESGEIHTEEILQDVFKALVNIRNHDDWNFSRATDDPHCANLWRRVGDRKEIRICIVL